MKSFLKKFVWGLAVTAIVVLAGLTIFVRPAFAQGAEPPVPTSPATLPSELQALIAMGIGYLVTQGLKSISKLAGGDITNWAAVITAGLVTGLVAFFNALLVLVPAAYQSSVSIGLTLLVAVFGAFGVHTTIKRFQPAAKK